MAENRSVFRFFARLLWIAPALVACVGAAHWYMLIMPGTPHAGPLPPLTAEERETAAALRRHVDGVASRPHNTAHPEALEASARYIEERLAGFGLKPRAQRFQSSAQDVRNIEIVLDPNDANPSAIAPPATLVVGAHYDSYGDAPGANDNGSGTAALLILAERLKRQRPAVTRVRLVFFVNEEPPHFKAETMGSLHYARALAATGETVKGMLSLETLGAYYDAPGTQRYPFPVGLTLPGEGNFVAIVGQLNVRPFATEVIRVFRETTAFPSVGGVAPGFLPGIMWSDHWSFAKFGIPALMLTDTALFRYPHYHLPTDMPDKLDYERLARVTGGIEHIVRSLAP